MDDKPAAKLAISAIVLSVPIIAITWCCMGMSKNYPVRGRVVTTDVEIVGSYILTRQMEDEELGAKYKPASGARIYLSFDEDGKNPVAGYEARSDEKGHYHIDTSGIPPGKDARYYLVTEKEGYEPARQRLGLGFMSSYIQNTVVLKPAKAKD